MPRPLRVSVLITEIDGSSLARCFLPYACLEQAGELTMLDRWRSYDADIVVFHRYWKADTLELMRGLQRQSVRVVVDLDDDIFNLPRSNPAWHEYQQPELRAAAKRVLKAVDGVFVSTENLREKIGHYSSHVEVVPNSVDPRRWQGEPCASRETVTIGFAGSASHVGDLDLLRGVLGPLLTRFPQVRLTFMGASPAWLAAEIGEQGMRRTRLAPLVPATEFPGRLMNEHFDIGLAPLAKNPFNESRSNLKFLEYAMAGAVTVASDVGPFTADSSLPMTRVPNNPRAWLTALSHLVESASYRSQLLAAARECAELYSVERQAPLLKAALESLKPDRGRVPFKRPPEPFPATRPVTVVMPVHDAPELTRDAIAAVLPELNASKRLILIDDGSRLPETVHLLADTVRRNDFVRVFAPSPQGALGFVAAANFGMREAQADDVILLNSDTRVSPGFIDRLRATAYSHPRYGTVTAVSNNGSIASVPYLSDSVELCRRETGAVIAPTAVGHCMYIRREVLDEFGAFDSVFGKGYGEENDLSQRIRAKYDNVIDPGCYVWHKGSASFAAAEKRALNDKNLQIVHQRYPHYPFEVFAFQSSDPLRPVRKRMLRATRDPRRRVLNICHSYGVAAGTEKHVRDLALGLSDTTLSFIAAPDGHGREGLHLYQGETHLGTHPYLQVPWPIAPSTMPLMESTWTDVIDEVRPDIIHLHHLLKHPLGLIERLVTSDIPVVVSVHDHFFLCPDYTLLGCPGTDRCQDCFVKKFGAGHADYQIYRRRIFDGALRKAAAVITPSEDTSRRLREVYPGLKITVIPHGIRAAAHAGSANKVQKCSENGTQVPLRFGYIGNLTHQKGLNTLLAAFSSAVRRAPCELHLWGHANNLYKNACNKPYMYYHGAYSTEELPSITEKFDVGIVPSIFPETFCYTLSELSSAGLPCLVADIGSLGERVRHGLNGWKVVPGDVAAWEDALVGVAKNPQLLMSLDHRPAVRSIGEMCRDYDHLYAALCSIKSPFTILT